MAATYAQTSDVVAAFDEPLPAELMGWVQNRLDTAELLVTAIAGDLTARIAAGKTTAEAVRIVLVEMVLRVLRNPGGYRQEASGPFSYTLDAAVSSGRLSLSRTDRRLLGLGGGAGTIALDDPALPDIALRPTFGCWPDVNGCYDAGDLPLP